MNYNNIYVRLLSYNNALQLINYVNSFGGENYANIVSGGVSLYLDNNLYGSVNEFLNDLDCSYEISDQPPYKTIEQLTSNFKK